MSERTEDALVELIAREQRGFRRILIAGVAILGVLVVMSAGLGVYYYTVSQRLTTASEVLERQAFLARIANDQQNNLISDQAIAIREAYNDIRELAQRRGDVSADQIAAALQAVRAYLQHGSRITLQDERTVQYIARAAGPDAPPPAGLNASQTRLVSGAAKLLNFDARTDAFPDDPTALPASLQAALADFTAAASDPALAAPAQAGMASIYFRAASARAFSKAACAHVIDAVEQSAALGPIPAQPLYWRAQCERKIGATQSAIAHYASALEAALSEQDASVFLDRDALGIRMNAFHGLGTTLIAGYEISEQEPDLARALQAAERFCPPIGPADADREGVSPRMSLALRCLDQAIALRIDLGQTPNQRNGTRENLAFAYLRDGNFELAYQSAQGVAADGMLAWNELVRALSSEHVAEDSSLDTKKRTEAAEAAREARRNVGYFSLNQYNVCELRALLSDEVYAEAYAVLRAAHPDATTYPKEMTSCAPGASGV